MRRLAWLGVVGLSACQAAPTEKTGNLGHGTFEYTCVSNSDSACSGPSSSCATLTDPGCVATTFPNAVALGSRFRLDFFPDSSVQNPGNPALFPISPEYVGPDNGTGFTALKPGYAGIYASASTNGALIDFTLVRVQAPSSLNVLENGQPLTGALTVHLNAKVTLTAQAVLGGAPLAGTMDADWSVNNTMVASPSTSVAANQIELTGVAAGNAVLTVAGGNVQATLNVVVM